MYTIYQCIVIFFPKCLIMYCRHTTYLYVSVVTSKLSNCLLSAFRNYVIRLPYFKQTTNCFQMTSKNIIKYCSYAVSLRYLIQKLDKAEIAQDKAYLHQANFRNRIPTTTKKLKSLEIFFSYWEKKRECTPLHD